MAKRNIHERAESVVGAERILEAVEADENVGFCLGCGEETYGVEPDAVGYPCEACGEKAVYGAQELLFYVVA
jgi:predicted RNA-binding Zn-ribbon protein involved in translation (DUF1610 family)